jgi:hypothetical protein
MMRFTGRSGRVKIFTIFLSNENEHAACAGMTGQLSIP